MVARLYSRRLVPRRRSCHSSLSRFNALHTCSIVTSGFFPPQPPRVAGYEGQHQQAQRLLPHERRVVPPLIVREAQLALAHAEGVLHIPAAEGHAHQRLELGAGGRVGQEILLLPGRHIPGPDQPIRPRTPFLVLHLPDARRLHLPDLRALRLSRQLDLDPRPPQERRALPYRVIGTLPLHRAGRFVPGAVDRQAGQTLGDLTHEPQLPLVQAADEFRRLAVALIEGDPVQGHLGGPGPIQLLQGDRRLGPIPQVIGDAGRPTARAVIGPLLRQEQLGIEQRLVAALADAEVDGDDAIVDLADTAEVLALYAGGLVAGLHGRGLIDQPDVAQAIVGQGGQFVGDVLLQSVAELGVLPLVVAQELLQSAYGAPGGQGHRLDTLAFEIGEQAPAVGGGGGQGFGVAGAVQVRLQELIESSPESIQLFFRHGGSPRAGLRLVYILNDPWPRGRSAVLLDFYATDYGNGNPTHSYTDPNTGITSYYGEGQTYLGSRTVTTDANGSVSFTADLAV